MMMFVGSQSFISLPIVGAAVSEIRELNQKKKEKEKKNVYFQSNNFPRCNIELTSYFLTTSIYQTC